MVRKLIFIINKDFYYNHLSTDLLTELLNLFTLLTDLFHFLIHFVSLRKVLPWPLWTSYNILKQNNNTIKRFKRRKLDLY